MGWEKMPLEKFNPEIKAEKRDIWLGQKM